MDAAAAAVARRLPACLENMLHGRPGVHVPALPPPLPPLPASVASNRAMASVQQPRAACCWSHRSWPPHRPAWWRGRGPPGPPAGGWLDPSPPHPCPVANQRGRTRAREYGGGRGWSRDRYLRRPPPRAALGWVWCGRGLGRHGVRVRLGIQGRARRLRHPPGGVSSGTTAWLGSAALPAPGPCPRLGPPGTLPRVVLNRRVVTCPHARPTRAAQLESEQRGVPSHLLMGSEWRRVRRARRSIQEAPAGESSSPGRPITVSQPVTGTGKMTRPTCPSLFLVAACAYLFFT